MRRICVKQGIFLTSSVSLLFISGIPNCACWAFELTYSPGTILENYFGRRPLTRETELPLQLGCMGICEPSGRVEIHKPGRVYWRTAVMITFLSIFKVS